MRFKEFALEKKLYIDLDGVLCDFEKQFKDLVGISTDEFESKYSEKDFWKVIGEHGENYWSQMPWMKDGKKLWSYVKKFNPTILSTPSRDKTSETGKIKWIKRELGNVPYILIREKEKYANDTSVLVDDLTKKINRWNAKGGIGILHKSADQSIKQLKGLGF